MDDHFDRMLSTEINKEEKKEFIRSDKFKGGKEGYVFHIGPLGLGYYLDKYQIINNKNTTNITTTTTTTIIDKKRKINEIENNTIDKLLEESEQNNEIEILNNVTLTKLLLSFEKKINKNQTMRMKYPNQPENFLDSEMDLHKEINNLYAVSASPELYPIIVESGSIPSILGMIAHDNTDISIVTIGLILELTDPDTILESDSAEMLIDSLLENQALELIVQNLGRLDESQDSDAQGVHDSLEIIENLVEIRPSLSETICEKTHILRFILNRINTKTFDDNKLYCSEILSILLQSGSKNLKRLQHIQPETSSSSQSNQIDGIEMLLQAIFPYRKKDPNDSEEKEYLQNIFLCLCTSLMEPENQIRFKHKEGFELMEKFLKENKYAAATAIKVISYAILNNKENCLQLIQCNGLKYLFPLFMGRGAPSGINKAGKRELEESVISIISHLCLQLHDSNEYDSSARILNKLTENQLEKTERCIELYFKYLQVLSTTESEFDILLRNLSTRISNGDSEAEIELNMLNTPETRYLKRLDGGLHMIQQLVIILSFVCILKSSNESIIKKIIQKLNEILNIDLSEIQNILRELILSYDTNNESNEEDEIHTQRMQQRNVLIQWSACLGYLNTQYNNNSS